MSGQPPPTKIGRYHLVREIGRGGMGVVYQAEDPFIHRPVAIKTSLKPPPKDHLAFEAYQQRFFNEARAAGRLNHRNIVTLYDADVEENRSYLVMEFVDGQNLAPFCRPSGLLPIARVVNIVFQCAQALDFAHKQDLIHRDIKPANILIGRDGRPKISDFGIAKLKGDRSDDETEPLTGSIHYTSPEALRKQPVNSQTDLYSLGVVMFELLTGSRPYNAESITDLVWRVTHGEAQKIRSIRPDVPEPLERIAERCLDRDLTQRYQSGQELAQDLLAAFDHLKRLKDEINQEERIVVLKKINFFKDFTHAELAEVLKATSWVQYEPAATIILEGELDDCFYIIVAGEVAVRKKGQILARLKTGDCFGEMAYLGKTQRTATILSVGPTILMKINASVIDQTSLSTQLRFYRVFAGTLITRLARTSELLSKSGL